MYAAPRVALRVDASATIGTGHLRRCLSLAQAFSELGASVQLLVRRLDNVAPHVLLSSTAIQGLEVHWLPEPVVPYVAEDDGTPHQAWASVHWAQDVSDTLDVLRDKALDWLVVDHYAFDARWQDAVRQGLGCRLLAIDDVADRELDVDALLDQNWEEDHRMKYAGCLRRKPRWLSGPRYALLGVSYRGAPRYRFHEQVRSVGIFLGGTDPGGASEQALQICRRSGFIGPIEIVSTSANPYLAELRAACAATPNTYLTLDEPDLAAFFMRHDLQIGAGGSATWERCCIGPPTVALVLAANQLAVIPALDQQGVLSASRLDSQSEPVDMLPLSQVFEALLNNPAERRAQGERAVLLTDGRGAQRVALSLLCGHLRLRLATEEDGQMLHRWRNHAVVRLVSGRQHEISLAEHLKWLQGVLDAGDRWLFVAKVGHLPVGCIRFDRVAADRVEVSIYIDPELHGLGLGQQLLLRGEQAMQGNLDHGFTVDANVMPGNAPSQQLFKSCGYLGGPLQYQKTVGKMPSFM